MEWRELLKAAGIDDAKITGHWTRHTVVSTLARLRVDARVIGDLMGHSAEVDRLICTHTSEQQREEAMAALGGRLVGRSADRALAPPRSLRREPQTPGRAECSNFTPVSSTPPRAPSRS